MFTGLIEDLGRLQALEQGADGARLRIATKLAGELGRGDSIAVNGVCLTATGITTESFEAEAINETLRRSTLGTLQVGDPLNLELAMALGERLGGHIVQGHVDGTGSLAGLREEGFSRVLEIELEDELGRYLVEKGSVAVNGVSLTVSAITDAGFEVSLIPETLAQTNLGTLEPGAPVNIEVDILAKHVERLMGAPV